MYIEYNPNPCGRRVGDCAVRAISKALDWSPNNGSYTITYNYTGA